MAKFYYDAVLGLVYWDFSEKKDYDYARDNKRWVSYNVNKPKVKLRQYIGEKAEKLASISMATAPTLKKIFIEAYNIEGIDAVDRVYNEAVKRVIKSVNK